jgi:hypothetical protein
MTIACKIAKHDISRTGAWPLVWSVCGAASKTGAGARPIPNIPVAIKVEHDDAPAQIASRLSPRNDTSTLTDVYTVTTKPGPSLTRYTRSAETRRTASVFVTPTTRLGAQQLPGPCAEVADMVGEIRWTAGRRARVDVRVVLG